MKTISHITPYAFHVSHCNHERIVEHARKNYRFGGVLAGMVSKYILFKCCQCTFAVHEVWRKISLQQHQVLEIVL